MLLVLGSEGEGVSRTISKIADHKVILPPNFDQDQIGKYPYNMIDSLNVGVSAALFITLIKKQQIGEAPTEPIKNK